MPQASQSGFLVYVATAGDNRVMVLHMASAAGPPDVVQKVDLAGYAAVGGVSMPAVCFLTGWRAGFRHLFFIPVTALAAAVIQTLHIGPP